MKRFRIAFLLFFTLSLPSWIMGQGLTENAFLKAIDEESATWEASYTRYSRFRFAVDKTDILDEKGEVARSWKTEMLEPGLIRGTFKDNFTIWFSFNDEVDTFCSPNVMQPWAKFCAFTVAGPNQSEWPGLTTNPDSIVRLDLDGHYLWKSVKLGSKTATPVLKNGEEGKPFPVLRYHDHAVVALTNMPGQKSAGCFILSRTGDKGWYTEGPTIASGAKTFRSRVAKSSHSSLNTKFVRRSNQFAWYLLKMDKVEQAYAQEHYAEYYMLSHFGEDSARTIDGLRVMGERRASSYKYKLGPYWLEKARDLALTHYKDDPKKIVEFEVGFAYGLYQAGRSGEALEVLKGMPEQPDWKAQFGRLEHRYVTIIAGEAFARGEYDKAAKWMNIMAEQAPKFKQPGWAVTAKRGVAACYLAKRDEAGALKALNEAIAIQEARQKANPKTNYSTQYLSHACTALAQWEPAFKYSEKGDYKTSYYKYEEIARLIAMWNKGDKDDAITYAKHIYDRFDEDLSEVRRSGEYHEVYLALIEVLSDPASNDRKKEFRKRWVAQLDFLKARPLQNYIFSYIVAQADILLGP